MACGRRWPHTTRCCFRRSRPMGLAVQAHRGRCVRLVRVTLVCCRCRGDRAAGAGVAGADGDRDRRSRVAGDRLLRRGAQSCCAGDGRRAWRSDPVGISGVDLVDLGPRRLRDLPTAVGLFQVRAAGLRTDFPPLRALDASPGNLRPAVTSFIGRDSEVAEVQAAVKAHRLMTLTGGGRADVRFATLHRSTETTWTARAYESTRLANARTAI